MNNTPQRPDYRWEKILRAVMRTERDERGERIGALKAAAWLLERHPEYAEVDVKDVHKTAAQIVAWDAYEKKKGSP